MSKNRGARTGWTLLLVFLTVVLLGAGVAWLLATGGQTRILGARWWDALTALGTVLAVVVALGLAVYEAQRARRAESALAAQHTEQELKERFAIASLVAGAIETSCRPSDDGTHYLQRATMELSNASTEPVFDVQIIAAKGDPPVRIGPLSAPFRLPVLPAQTTRNWDISTGIIATADKYAVLGTHPTVEIHFTDARRVRWRRGFDGSLAEFTSAADMPTDDGNGQLGELDNFLNPMTVVVEFLKELRAEDSPSQARLSKYFAPNASGWGEIDQVAIRNMADSVRDSGLATHVWYPAPQVAWVRLRDSAEDGINIITLCFLPGTGWRVFSVGAALGPHVIPFPEGSLTDDLRGPPPQ